MFKLTRREFLKLTLWSGIYSVAGGVAAIEYAHWVESTWWDVNPVDLTLPRLPRVFDGFRLVQISDIHHDEWMTQEILAEVIDIVNDLEPDAVAITGDFITGYQDDHHSVLTAELGRLQSKYGKFAVLGNHDYWADADLVRKILQDGNVIEVPNDIYTIEKEGSYLHICGVDDYWEKHDDLDAVLDKLPQQGCAILMCHEPDFADFSAASGHFDLQLSGHSHGGQVVWPFFPPPVVPDLAKKYPSGLYQVGDMFHYTNRGVGMIPPYVRFNCRPEITVFTLHAPDFVNSKND